MATETGIRRDYENRAIVYNTRLELLRQQYERDRAALENEREQALAESYVEMRSDARKLPQQLAAEGRTGGQADSAYAELIGNYLRARRSAKERYGEKRSDLDFDYNAERTELGAYLERLKAQAEAEIAALKAKEAQKRTAVRNTGKKNGAETEEEEQEPVRKASILDLKRNLPVGAATPREGSALGSTRRLSIW